MVPIFNVNSMQVPKMAKENQLTPEEQDRLERCNGLSARELAVHAQRSWFEPGQCVQEARLRLSLAGVAPNVLVKKYPDQAEGLLRQAREETRDKARLA